MTIKAAKGNKSEVKTCIHNAGRTEHHTLTACDTGASYLS